ncbi:membrane protein [Mycobacterium antarcticum]|uniref:SHOCT domain-containing protein n=1 Tax=unclassified Mycolicibacterium TaxID=2636767 RepID=UPI00238C67B2|nr:MULTISPECIES: SHOCT domain-containing protein [unclassified Mycolicibacterium]BDX34176.1 membrane protein [Mycolicibacterium sp. TUM20985]GLP82218.1 membrane protein [Mycolicibacterium sp. TUM20984]
MVGRYVKAQLMVLLCGGLVGPIFLAVYFALGEATRPYIGWMFWVGLLITAADVLIAIGLATYGAKSAAKTQMLETGGVLALAQVTFISETGTRINDQPMVKIGLHVEGPGIRPFDVEDRVIASVTRLPLITGRKLVVLVDPATNEYQIDWNRSALVGGMMPAQFTLAEDGNRTYDLSGQAGPLMEIMQILKANGVPLNGTIDIRSNPAVRQQVMNVVRRAAAQQVPPAAHMAAPSVDPAAAYVPPPMPAAPAPSTAQRLQELETLRAMGTISDAEYGTKRQQIISEL